MNYRKHYNSLILRGQHRAADQSVYYEKHHILPRCLGGSDAPGNLVLLTPEEHFVAHLLLAKIYDNYKLWLAVSYMTAFSRSNTDRQNVSNKRYGWIKRRVAAAASEKSKHWHKNNVHPMSGRKHSESAKKKISEKLKMQTGGTPVFKYTVDGKFICGFPSLKHAAADAGRSSQTIWAACQDTRRTAAGCKYSYEQALTLPNSNSKSHRKRFTITNKQTRGLHNREPWEILDKRQKNDLSLVWKKADLIFDLMKAGKDKTICSELGMNAHVVRKIKAKIKSGWNPRNDTKWIQWRDKE